MRVLLINSVSGYGSTGRIVNDIQKILEEQGHECLIAYGRGNAPEGINSVKIGTIFDNYMHVAKTRLLDKHGFASTKATKKIIQRVKEFNPDVVHLHNIHGYYIDIELLFEYLKEANIPVVWTLHDCWSFTGHCAYFDYVRCDKWKNGCYRCPQKHGYPKSFCIDNSKCNYEKKRKLFTALENMTIVTPSNWLSDLVKQSFLQKYEVKVINNGIDLKLFSPKNKKIFREKNNLKDTFIILGVASKWDKRKGLKHFIELSNLIDSDSRIVLVGLNKKQKINLPQNVIGINRTNSIDELAEIYSSADVFVNPTLEDNFPTTNIESLACGTPVVTYNTGGSPESIDDSCGEIVDKGNINSLFDKIMKYKYSTNDLKSCRDKASEFEKKSQYLKYIELYTHMLS